MVDTPTFNETFAEMEKLLATGKVKAIGVSNFSVKKCVFSFLELAMVVIILIIILRQPHKPIGDG